MAKVGTAEYDVLLSRAKIQGEVNAASRQIEQGLGQSAKQVEREFAESSKKIGDNLGSSAKRAQAEFAETAKQAVGAFAIYKGGQFLGDSVQAASDLAEAQSKVGVVFGSSSDSVLKFGDNSAKALGQSKRQALEAAGTFGNLFVAVGLAESQSADMSTTLTALASDLASFNNTSIDEALTALRSGLVGETEPLKRFGVNLNEATLKAKAMSLGLADGTGVLSSSAKAQAAYALILEQTGTAQGDFARTSDQLANTQRISAAEYDNAKTELGEGLLPIMQTGVEVGGALAKMFGALPGPIQTGAVALTGLTVVLGVFGPKIAAGAGYLQSLGASGLAAAQGLVAPTVATTALGTAADRTTGSLIALDSGLLVSSRAATQLGVTSTAAATGTTAMGTASAKSAGGLGKVSGALAVATAGLTAYNLAYGFLENRAKSGIDTTQLATDLDQVGRGVADTSILFDEMDGSVEKLAGAFEDKKLKLDPGFTGLIGLAKGLAGSGVEAEKAKNQLDDYDSTLAGLAANGNSETARKAFGELSAALIDQGVTAEEIAQKFPEYFDALESAERENTGATGAITDNTEALKAQADARDEAVEAAGAAVDTARDVFAAERSAADAVTNTAEAQAELTDARAAARGQSDEYRAALADIAQAESDVADAAKDTRRAQEDLNDARKEAAETLEDLQFAAEGAALSAERAQLRLEDALASQYDVLEDPASSERDKREAALAIKEAELGVREAQDARTDSAEALAEAERKGVEGSDAVVAAKERVAEALDAQSEAEGRVASAAQAAAVILDTAKADVEEASRKLIDAFLDEAEQQRTLAELTGTSAEANDAYVLSLLKSTALLDPSSPTRKNLLEYIADVNRLNEALESITAPTDPALGPSTGEGGGSTTVQTRPTESTTIAGTRGANLTVNMRNGPSVQEVSDELMWPRGGGG